MSNSFPRGFGLTAGAGGGRPASGDAAPAPAQGLREPAQAAAVEYLRDDDLTRAMVGVRPHIGKALAGIPVYSPATGRILWHRAGMVPRLTEDTTMTTETTTWREHDHTTPWQVCRDCGLTTGEGIATEYDAAYYAHGHDAAVCPRCGGRMGLDDRGEPEELA